MKGAPLVVLTDFDFTISLEDVGDLVTLTLAPPSEETMLRLSRKEIGSRIYWSESMARVKQAEGEALADQVGIDPHFAAFARWCEAEAIPLAVVSDGFWFYISRILGREGLGHLPVFCNEMDEPDRLAWPHGNPACEVCGCCKALVARRVREAGARIIYVGDGISDLYAAAFADWVFAKGRLARHMAEHGSPFFPLGDFADVLRTLQKDPEAFRRGTAPGRATLQPDPICRF
jgi:2-hydroxy-3-keto-5-methylthiopentenyl-1-phosphate phosphatase